MMTPTTIVRTEGGTRCPFCGTDLMKLPQGTYVCGYSKSIHFDEKVGDYVCEATPCQARER